MHKTIIIALFFILFSSKIVFGKANITVLTMASPNLDIKERYAIKMPQRATWDPLDFSYPSYLDVVASNRGKNLAPA
jgi:hypothetical protein